MSTAPPDIPFGDPAANQQRNRSAVGKGVGIACGGCAVLLLLGAIACAGIFFMVFKTLGNSDVVKQSVERAAMDQRVVDRIGSPIERGWLITGSININNGSGTADVSFPVSGPKGGAQIHAVATKAPGGPWVFTTHEATISSTSEKIDLLQSPPPSG